MKLAQKVMKCGVKKEAGYLYFIDKDGDIARSKMARGGKKKKAKPAAKKTAKKKVAKKKKK
jgi:hypothetical protein